MAYRTRVSDSTEQLDAALHQIPAVLAELMASLVRVPLLTAQLATSIIAVPFLAIQVATNSLGQMVERIDVYVDESIRARHVSRRPNVEGDMAYRLGEMLGSGRPSPADDQYRREPLVSQSRPAA
ncbi:MAG: hypothetical protein V3V35_09925 [Dehalococcoidia bacterium]